MDQSHISPYKSLDFFARQVVEGFITGRHRSPFHGFSVEFSDYRQYNPGESTAHIDWHLYARTDRLYIKQYQEETNLRCRILIDNSSSMLFPLERQGQIEHPNKLTFSIYAAAVLIEILHRQRDAFGLTFLSDGIETSTPCRSNTLHQRYLLGLLDETLTKAEKEDTQRTTNIVEALHLIAEQQQRRSLMIIFTDAFVGESNREPLIDALRHMRHKGHEVIIFHTYDREHEVELHYDARPHQFIDLETGQQLRVQPNEIVAEYSRIMQRQFDDLHNRALQYRIDYVPVDIANGFHQIILPFLLKRSKIY
ncbi:MAG: DUF58 domain-containing protein [Bacteroidales bacterium]|nr:DUF58 domain-containing protein [Bacteroidales bacterium]